MMNPDWSDAAICEAFMQDMIDSISLERKAEIEDEMYEPWGGYFSKRKPILFVQEPGQC